MAIGDGIKNTLNEVFGPDPVGLPNYEPHGIPGNVQRILDDAAVSTGKKIWNGMVHAAATGFGKGIILTALIIIGVTALQGGFIAPALFGTAGGIMMGIGGLLGMVMDIRQHQSKISADVAKAEAAAFEAIRLQKQAERSKTAESMPDFGFAAREAAKRASVQQQLIGK